MKRWKVTPHLKKLNLNPLDHTANTQAHIYKAFDLAHYRQNVSNIKAI